jgi:hypothetical protein
MPLRPVKPERQMPSAKRATIAITNFGTTPRRSCAGDAA